MAIAEGIMDIVYYLLPVALLLGGFFLVTFLFAVKSGQFDDLDTPAHRMLIDDEGEQCDKQN